MPVVMPGRHETARPAHDCTAASETVPDVENLSMNCSVRKERTMPNVLLTAVVQTRPWLSTETDQLSPPAAGAHAYCGPLPLRLAGSETSYANRPPSWAETKRRLPSRARSRTMPCLSVKGRSAPCGLRKAEERARPAAALEGGAARARHSCHLGAA